MEPLSARTPLHDRHVALGARMVPFAGFLMPLTYQGSLAEHRAVREQAGLFDVSHMGEFLAEGQEAALFLDHLLPRCVSGMATGTARYTVLTNEEGGIVDDLMVYRLGEQRFLLVVNAANIDKDWQWITGRADPFDLTLTDLSRETALLALQGPRAAEILQGLTPQPLAALRPFRLLPDAEVAGMRMLLARTGYTGEDGFELFLPAVRAGEIWDRLLSAGQSLGLRPAGLSARDSLRLEAALPLYGQDLSEDTSPLEAGLTAFVEPDKETPFPGQSRLQREAREGTARRLAGFVVEGREIPRSHYPLRSPDDGSLLGEVTSGGFAPSLGQGIALAYLPANRIQPGQPLRMEVRGRTVPARVVELPFYQRMRKERNGHVSP